MDRRMANGVVYASSMAKLATQNQMFALDAATGQILWEFGAGSSVNSGPAVVDGTSDRLVPAFKRELAPYEISKGTIRFPLSEPVPLKLIERVAKFRAKEVAARGKARAAASKKR